MLRRAVPAVLLTTALALVGYGVAGLQDVDAELTAARAKQVTQQQLADGDCPREERRQRSSAES